MPSPGLDKNGMEIPHNYLIAIAQIISGDINDTNAFDKFNGPILKSSIKSVYWVFLIQYAILSIAGIVTNAAIVTYTMYHKLYKDVTHSFIVNLGLCHFIQCSIVLPITLMVMIIQNWIFGQFMCFFLPMLQDIPLHVAMISHILIAWDRMRWLGDPMRGRLPAFVCCCATWLTGMIIVLPYPIYTMYVELGDYVPKLSGIGLCLVNLMDDMHEYMRGLFVLMYCGPAILLSYLYIRTSQELRPPDGPFAVMMFEHRARQRNSSTTSVERSNRTNMNRTYDLYNAELDVTREKRTQRNLGSMAAAQVLCVCPLMILRLARMVMVETYENTKHFDFTYLMFVWLAFLPTIIFPCIYASEILPRNDKDRLRGYFRLSSKRSKKFSARDQSIENEDTTTTTTIQTTATIIQNNYQDSLKLSKADNIQTAKNIENAKMNAVNKRQKTTASSSTTHTVSGRNKFNSKTGANCNNGKQLLSTSVGLHRNRSQFGRKHTTCSIDNSCSNITSSTYCDNSNATEPDCENSSAVSIDYDNKKWLSGVSPSMVSTIPAIRNRDGSEFSDGGSFTPLGSSSTLERDLEIIDLLERERSMDIQEMMERERRRGCGSLNSNGSERRRLPDLDKICKSPKLKINPYNYDVPTHKELQQTSTTNLNTNTVNDTEDEEVPEPYLPPSTSKFYSRRMNRKSSHQSSNSHRAKRDSVGSLNGDFIAGAFGELDPTQPLSKMSVIENRMRRSSARTNSISSSSGRSSFRSRDYNQPQHSHPELDFRENIFAEL